MKFEVIGPDGSGCMSTEYPCCVPLEETLERMAKCGYSFRLNGRAITRSGVLLGVAKDSKMDLCQIHSPIQGVDEGISAGVGYLVGQIDLTEKQKSTIDRILKSVVSWDKAERDTYWTIRSFELRKETGTTSAKMTLKTGSNEIKTRTFNIGALGGIVEMRDGRKLEGWSAIE